MGEAMQKWYQLFPKNTGLSLYAWIGFCLLPFYFIFRLSALKEIVVGVFLIILFFTVYRLAFIKKGWTVYVSVALEIVISIGMTLYFGYVYFALFLAFFIGNIEHRGGFITLYVIHLVTTIAAVVGGFLLQQELFITQLPFILIAVVGVILLPFTMYNRMKQDKLQGQLNNAKERIAQLMVIEERERIARDLHDTLGQKLSLIGLKSDLAAKLVEKNPKRAIKEAQDIQQTARTALNEVREMVSMMKNNKLSDELIRVQHVIEAAELQVSIEGKRELTFTPLLVEHVLSMCLKETITNIVKHSQASRCEINIHESESEVVLQVKDNGIGIPENQETLSGHGIKGMKERLDFVNGSMDVDSSSGTLVTITVPLV